MKRLLHLEEWVIVLKQNRSKVSVRWKIFIYIASFALGMIVLLWLFQVVFLDQFYKEVKTQQIKETTNEIADHVAEDNLADYLDNISSNSDYCVRIIDLTNNTSMYENNQNKGVCGLLINDLKEIRKLYVEALNNNGTVLQILNSEGFVNKFNDFSNRYSNESEISNYLETTRPPLETMVNNNDMQTMTYGKITSSDDADYFVLVNSRITIVNEIAETIRTQLLIISVILLLFSMLIAFLIASKISKPIIKINESAKILAEGKFNIQFEGKGYLEIEELNDTLNYASMELSKVEKLRNELIANMSHDLRTPLTMIAGYGEVMRDLPNENTPENVQVIIDECNRLTALVNDILDLSKIQSKVQSLEKGKFNLTELIEEIVNRFMILLKQEQYTIKFIHDEDVFVSADQIKINQVMYNLLVNAVHYTGSNHEVVIRQMIDKDNVTIEVIDSGEGISSENLPYVWDRYYKLDKTHKRNKIGSGLGLSIVKGILELHEAKYGVSSKVEEGTTFYFTLKREI